MRAWAPGLRTRCISFAVAEVDLDRCFAGVLGGDRDEGLADVEAGDLILSTLGQFDGKVAGTGSDFEDVTTEANLLRQAIRQGAELGHVFGGVLGVPGSKPSFQSHTFVRFVLTRLHEQPPG